MPTRQPRRRFLKTAACAAGAGLFSRTAFTQDAVEKSPPNFIIIFADDLGYGDLGVFGHPTIRTPNLDRMAREGQKWTQFYAAASVCTPSRAGILTGRLPIRNGMCSDKRRVLFPDSAGGLPESEITIAEALKSRGYATAAIGKWHLGHLPQFLPTRQGFDSYFGIPYSNDMDRVNGDAHEAFQNPKPEYFNVPLMRNEEVVERPADQNTITRRYTDEAIRIIQEKKDGPFFIYLAHNLPHVPLFASQDFRDKSLRGLYGDVVQEIDAGVGRILQTLREEGLAENTYVVFTSDNGPWLQYDQQGGSAGLLRDGKGTTWEGGMREPTIVWGPGRVKPGVVNGLGSTLDLLPTFCTLAGASIPDDRVLDGLDLSSTWLEEAPSPRKTMFYYRGEQLYAVRKGPWKAHFISQSAYKFDKGPEKHETPLLFNLNVDPGESFNVAGQHPDVIAEIKTVVEQHKATLSPVENQLEKRIARPAENAADANESK
ncbi:MAG: sulfatase-like hydrolase/transferase [bacterium]|nr:sulfatase-like hydrolase/transferase [bacterium]